MRELYKTLGFTEDESRLQGEEFQKLCKKKFRELSKEWHPDRWSNGSEEERKKAEEKFKEINEANAILSDPNKRQMYDLTGSVDGNANTENDFDPFAEFLRRNGFGGGSRTRVNKGGDLNITVTLTMKESYTGTTKKYKIKKAKKCSHCNGTGSSDGKTHNCTQCNGTGMFRKYSKVGYTQYVEESTCPYCHGSGNVIENPCPYCSGSGIEYEYDYVTVNIPSGIFTGAVMKMDGQGNAPLNGDGINGDLYVKFRVENDDQYYREENDINYKLKINVMDAWLGKAIEVENIDSSKYNVNVKPLTKNGEIITVKDKGFVDPNGMRPRGDFNVIVEYEVPKNITERQKELLKEFYEIENSKK